MKSLITGARGFLGKHLTAYLLSKGQTVYAAAPRQTKTEGLNESSLIRIALDMTDRQRVSRFVGKIKPDFVFHLAAQSLVMPSWKDPDHTFQVNVMGSIHLLDAIVKAKIKPTILVACSSAEYKSTGSGKPIREENPLEPASPYGISKLAQDHLAQLYFNRYGLKIIRMRPFLVIGPGKKQDVCSHFAQGITAIERGDQKVLKVGNLKAIRDFLDVHDATVAMWKMVTKGKAGAVYNLCSGKGTTISQILQRMINLAGRKIRVVHDPSRLRPLDEPI